MPKRILSVLLLLTALANAAIAQSADSVFSVYFSSGAAVPLKSGMERALRKLHAVKMKIIALDGYADSVGDPAANKRLSINRCLTVINILKANGANGEFRFEGHGEVNAGNHTDLAGNHTDLAENRRVDISVMRLAEKNPSDISTEIPAESPPKIATETKVPASNKIRVLHLDLNDVQFLPDIAAFTPASLLYLPSVLATLQGYPHAHFEIIGYVNWIPMRSEKRNSGFEQRMQELSQQRAKTLYEWLTDNGIDCTRMSYEGRGNDSLVFRNPENIGEKERNMRVQIVITDSVAGTQDLR